MKLSETNKEQFRNEFREIVDTVFKGAVKPTGTPAPPQLIREIRIRVVEGPPGETGYVLSYTWPGVEHEHEMCDFIDPVLERARKFLTNPKND